MVTLPIGNLANGDGRCWPWPTTAWRTGAGPVTRVLRSWTNERGRWDHSEDWSQHGAHSLLNATQVRHEAGKGFAYQRVLRILIPPYGGSTPPTPGMQSISRQRLFKKGSKAPQCSQDSEVLDSLEIAVRQGFLHHMSCPQWGTEMSNTQTRRAKREYCLQRAAAYDRFAEKHPTMGRPVQKMGR